MALLSIIGLSVLAIIVVIGIIRGIVAPYRGFGNFLMEILILDWLGDLLIMILSILGDILDD
jgi:hypothetical protein